MSRQIQIRRGSQTEHETFTGAIGEITMDTTNNTLRIHDGATVGGTALAKQNDLDNADYIIESQSPNAENNYSWYRKYKSGWIEQGGIWTGEITKNVDQEMTFNIDLLKNMQNNNYIAFIDSSEKNYCMSGGIEKYTNYIRVTFLPYESQRTLRKINWLVFGLAE